MQNYNCLNCGAELYWDVAAGCLKCKFCDSEYQVSDFDDQTKNSDNVENESMDREYANADNLTENMLVYECKTCGGEVVAMNTTMATVCPYCGEAISITSKSVGEFRPELCIPFKYDKKAIMRLYEEYVNKSFLTPKAFKDQSTIEKIQGLFTPFHLHSLTDKASHGFTGEQITSHKRGYDKVVTHRVFDLRLLANGKFEKIPIDGSTRVSNQLMESVEPFEYSALEQYNPAYMAGFLAEQTDDDKDEMSQRAETRAKSHMTNMAKSAFSKYSSVHLQDESHSITSHSSQYVMLPVWLLNVKHGDKKYTFAINGQTGKVVGKLPVDKMKLTLLSIGVFLAVNTLVSLLFMM